MRRKTCTSRSISSEKRNNEGIEVLNFLPEFVTVNKFVV